MLTKVCTVAHINKVKECGRKWEVGKKNWLELGGWIGGRCALKMEGGRLAPQTGGRWQVVTPLYSQTTYFYNNEPDLRWDKTIEKVVLCSQTLSLSVLFILSRL